MTRLLARRGVTALAAVALLAGAAVAAWCALGWYRAASANALIAANDPAAIGADAAPAARFAKAYALHMGGEVEAAVKVYYSLLTGADPRLQVAAHYNLANLYFLQAAIAASETRLRDLVPLVLQARAHYRRVLFMDPQHYAAKYNLEYVERLMVGRDWIGEQTRIGANTQRTPGGTGWVTVHELPQGLP